MYTRVLFFVCCILFKKVSGLCPTSQECVVDMLSCLIDTYDTDQSCTIDVHEFKKVYSHLTSFERQQLKKQYHHRQDLFDVCSEDGGKTISTYMAYQQALPYIFNVSLSMMQRTTEHYKQTLCSTPGRGKHQMCSYSKVLR